MTDLEYKKRVLDIKERELKAMKAFQKSNEEGTKGAFFLLGLGIVMLISLGLYAYFIL